MHVKFEPETNLSPSEIAAMIKASRVGAVRRIHDPKTGDYWYWPAEMALHGWGAKLLGVDYDTYGGGEVLMLEDS